jgi:hypothetical protein
VKTGHFFRGIFGELQHAQFKSYVLETFRSS